MDSFDLSKALRETPVGQQRTGSSKQFVMIQDEFVIKGPYPSKSKRLVSIKDRESFFELWKTPCIVRSCGSFSTKDGVFIKFPNLMKGHKLVTCPHTETFGNKLSYNILKDPPVKTLGNSPCALDGPGKLLDLLIGLCHCFVLKVGDMNMRNVLVGDGGNFYIVDFEDTLGKDTSTETFYFNRAPAKKSPWLEKIRPLYPKVIESMKGLMKHESVKEALPCGESILPRIKHVIDMLSGKDVEFSPTKTPAKKSVEKKERVMALVEGRNIGKMKYGGPFNGSYTFSGHTLDIAKSALQKYIRRGETRKALLAGVELYRMAEVGGAAATTNAYNRLAVISNEDIGVCNFPLIVKITDVVNSRDRDFHTFTAMIKLLCESKKTRMASHCWFSYVFADGRVLAKEAGKKIDEGPTKEDLKYVEENINSEFFDKEDPTKLKASALIFEKRLKEGDLNAFTWVKNFMDESSGVKSVAKRNKFIGARGATSSPDILLWKVMAGFLEKDAYNILVKAYYTQSEKRPFLQGAVLACVKGKKCAKVELKEMASCCSKDSEIKDMLEGKFVLEVDDYVIDKHTKAGKMAGRDTKLFVEDGSLVIPQDEIDYDKVLHDIYKTKR